jgi:tetratricopeptide (TPR) repeat protein
VLTSCHRFLTFLITFFFILCMPACQTLRERSDEEQRAEDLLNTQKNVIVNYINQGMPQMALKELRGLTRQYPQDADFKNLMGLTYLALQNPKMAATHFEEAYRLQPRAPIALNLSSAYIETKQYARAIKLLETLRTSNHGRDYQFPERIHHNIALAAERMGKLKLAEKQYLHAIEQNPYYYLSLMRLGQLYERGKRFNLAQAQYLRAREACLKCFDPIHALVTRQLSQSQANQAVQILQEYLANKEVETADRAKARQLLALATRAGATPPVSTAPRPAKTPPESQTR